MVLYCENCGNLENLEIRINRPHYYRVEYDPETKGNFLREQGEGEWLDDPELFCPCCETVSEVPKEFWPPHSMVEFF